MCIANEDAEDDNRDTRYVMFLKNQFGENGLNILFNLSLLFVISILIVVLSIIAFFVRPKNDMILFEK